MRVGGLQAGVHVVVLFYAPRHRRRPRYGAITRRPCGKSLLIFKTRAVGAQIAQTALEMYSEMKCRDSSRSLVSESSRPTQFAHENASGRAFVAVRACVRACARARVRACVRACVRARVCVWCVCACVCVWVWVGVGVLLQ